MAVGWTEDEVPEFGTRVLEVMRQPIEDKVVTISRAQGTLTFPANFSLVMAMYPLSVRGANAAVELERRYAWVDNTEAF
jgi:predicted ATPase with chaperone activity